MAVRNILISVDGSEHAARAFDWFVANMWRPDDRVIIFHISEPPTLPTFTFSSPVSIPIEDWQKIIQTRVSNISKIESDFTQRAIQKKMNHKFLEECMNNPGEGIVAYAREKNIDMVIMGSRGLGTLRRTFLGSVSDYVLHHCCKPVTVVPSE